MLILEILLSVIMVFDCMILVGLVLMQLPKKEAGAGLAFGGAATDALFGAGSGNFLTKATKYTAGLFFVLAIILSIIQSYRVHRNGSQFLQQIRQQNEQPAATAPAPPANTTPATQPTNSSPLLMSPLENTASNAAPANPVPSNTVSTNQTPQK